MHLLWLALAAVGVQESTGVRPVDETIRKRFKHKSDFYKKVVDAGGLLILSSEKVDDRALLEVRYLIDGVLRGRDDIRAAMVKSGLRIGVMDYAEFTTDIPEHSKLSPWWNKRARGLGGNPVTCAEENVLNYKGDPYVGENIFIHEFAHAIQHSGIGRLDGEFKTKLRKLYEQTKAGGRFSGYCMQNPGEFWAEGVQSWFDCNRREIILKAGKERINIRTRELLVEHMAEFAALLREVFGDNDWRYTTTDKRTDLPHLKGYDREQAPTFTWPKHILEAARKTEERKREGKKRKGGSR